MNLDTVCKQIIEDLSAKLYTNKYNEWSLYTLGDISAFIKSKLLQSVKEYYCVNRSTAEYNNSQYIQQKRAYKKIQFYPKKSSSSNYIKAIVVTCTNRNQKDLVDSLYLSLNKHIKHDTLPFGESMIQTKRITKYDGYTAGFEINKSDSSVQSFNSVIELNLSILDSITF